MAKFKLFPTMIPIMFSALDESISLGSEYMGSEHVLIAMLLEPTGCVKNVLSFSDIGKFREEVQIILQHAEKNRTVPFENSPKYEDVVLDGCDQIFHLTPRLKEIFEVAAERAHGRKEVEIDLTDVMIALLQDNNTVAPKVLENLGVNLGDAIQRIENL